MAFYGNGTTAAWARFNNTGGIIDDFNVSSVTDNATGRWTLNFDSNIASANSCCFGAGEWGSGGSQWRIAAVGSSYGSSKSTSSIAFTNTNPHSGALFDPSYIHAGVLSS